MTNEEFLREISLEGEVWKDVVGWEGLYAVSNMGRVVSFTPYNNLPNSPCRQKILNLKPDWHGYYMVSLYKETQRKVIGVHRLVAMAFIPNIENKPYIDHIDRNPLNNCINNLRWCSQSENLMNPLTRDIRLGAKHNIIPFNRKKIVQLKDGKLIATYDYIAQVKEYGYANSCVSRCCSGELKHYKGYQWMYLSDYEASCQ